MLREGPLEPARAVRILEQIAGALDSAHARGLVHRDVKPSNVLLDEREHAYLADFGLSRYLGDAALPLGPAKSLGTADYVAPEQIRGEEVDGRADVYALGCMLYECLAGEPPFRRGTDAATLYAQWDAEDALAAGDLERARAAARSAVSLVRRPFLPGEEGTWVEEKRSELADLRECALGVFAPIHFNAWRAVKCKGRTPPVCRSAHCYRCSTGLAGTARGRRRRGCRPGGRDVAHVAQTPSRRSGHRSDCLDPRCTRRHRPRRQAQHHESTSDHR